MWRFLTTTAMGLMVGTPLIAGDVAMIVGNSAYEKIDRLPAARAVTDTGAAFARSGVDVVGGRDLTARGMDSLFASLLRKVTTPDDAPTRIAVVLAGQFAESANDTFLLPVEAGPETDLNTVRDIGLSVSAVLALLSTYPGEAVLILGEGRDSGTMGAFLSYGVTLPPVPQGVTVLRGPASDVSDFVEEQLAEGLANVTVAEREYGLIVDGFAPKGRVFMQPMTQKAPVASSAITAPAPVPRVSEPALWGTTRQADTISAYRTYLDTFPDGPNAETAKAMIREIETEPFRAERLAEAALRLSRDDKRSIQRNLSLLGYDPRGIDGLFGPGSRGAITAWQKDFKFAANSYLTPNQIALLASQAERRAAELEEEARQRQEQQEREDRAYWEQTGALGDAPGLRAYLKRYPDGVFAEVAQERLRVLEEAAQAEAAGRESIAWEQAAELDTVEGYQDFVRDYPNGALAEEAQARIDAMSRSDEEIAAEERARLSEERLGLNRRTRTLVEDRLAKLGLKPGKIDGDFDDNTRRAIRRYQDARGMPVTGYLNQNTVVRLMADSIFR